MAMPLEVLEYASPPSEETDRNLLQRTDWKIERERTDFNREFDG
jgi:hypothetical protein